ncbi:hypothetical protein EJ08DRAFT_676700 [Tothia fuscella]|uniref:BTB domain-containing protein n=1 Tax=Tothia fuscella TaxID=1048955 RepID=A0A9P4NXL1_9PEZI|nr:hypothetical protein EJ08DRAFT_676700 [Tothia fuscella]
MPNPKERKDTQTARILIGDSPEPLFIDLDLICETSPFFANAFRGSFRESEEKEIMLGEVERESIVDFLHWLKTRDKAKDGRQLSHPTKLWPLLKLWVVADMYKVPELQNQAMFRIAKLYHTYNGKNIQPEVLEYVYEHSGTGSPIRRVMLDFAAGKMDTTFYSQNSNVLPLEFSQELCLLQMTRARQFETEIPEINAVAYYVAEDHLDMHEWQQSWRDYTPADQLSQPASPEQLASRPILTPRRKATVYQGVYYPEEL